MFVILEVDITQGDGFGIREHLCSFGELKCLQDFMDGYIKPEDSLSY